ncbi:MULTISPECIES: ABC transporter C-terminal domain-containing protein [unclassified Pseudomonas]|uniref:ABC transporter C-terminal domain-containing protein n=1 Tax=unclassified Pseudomonas TaxID=196821 RepID=UPI000C88D9E4|nr:MULTISPECIES: ABC transporter C-terminal domain-containing protein [unclassified Pseudomonas]PMX27611.1 hypothetical protein C1Y23_08095 [Pseudomonas sp. GW460-12]PMX35554.1 hypothetical protein C1Y24_09180 [Pseudomonas sp. MPR-R2A4]PMX42203.1 hypothetical protein C1Y26_07325 [Pseudomonas sp. MPR-R2A7]PMX53689.1 hypothetical protein C1Y17_12080 [Pseudomonas sp. MPR-R2A6]PMX90609.1 hypothetical protein C1Y21_15085 [Pseudomonas sp. MPR-R2A3]
MGKLGSLLCLGSIVFAAGCHTRLDVKPDGEGDYVNKGGKARIGVEYGLPMVQFNLAVTRTLVKCQDERGQTDIRFSTQVAAEPHYVVGERFVVDYESLSSWSKIAGLDLQTYDNGTLKSINASAEDQSAAIIGDVVKVGIGVASLVSKVPFGVQQLAPEQPGEWRCSEQTKRKLDAVTIAKDALEETTKKLVQTTDTVTRLESLAILNALSEGDKTVLAQTKAQQSELTKQVAAVDKALARLLTYVSVKEERVWPEKVGSTQLNADPLPANAKFLKDLFEKTPSNTETQGAEGGTATTQASKENKSDQPGTAVAGSKKDVFLEKLMASFQLRGELVPLLEPSTQSPGSTSYPGPNKEDKRTGLYYRTPIPAQLLICRVVSSQGCIVDDDLPKAFRVNVMAPQLAPLRVLPMTNGMFQNNALSATFRENGSLATFKYEDKAARGKVLSETVAASMDSVLAYRDARQAHKASEKAAKQQAGLDELDADIARLEKQKKIAALNAELEGSAQDTAVETARLNARIALLEAQRKLHELEGE